MAFIGTIEPFNPKEAEITAYIERLEQLFMCNDVADEKKVAMLLTFIGGEAYSVLKDLLAPTLPSQKTYAQLIDQLKRHYSPKRLIIAERYKFHTAHQESNEDINNFAVRLQNLAKHCGFGDFLNDSLRDRLVCGLMSDSIKRRLLTEDGLTFEQAYTTAIGMELAEGQLRAMGPDLSQVNKVYQKSNNQGSINKPKSGSQSWSQFRTNSGSNNANASFNQSNSRNQKCRRCNRNHFNNNNCPAISWKCFACGQMGHTAKSSMCRNRIQELEEVDEITPECVRTEDSDDQLELGMLSEDLGECTIKSLKTNVTDILKVNLMLDGQNVDMEVDSGAVRTVMHEKDFKKLFSNLVLEPVNFKLRVLTGQKAEILGQVFIHVIYLKRMFYLPLVILKSDTLFIPLLGRNWLNILNVNWYNNVLDSSVVVNKLNDIECLNKEVESSNVSQKLVSLLKADFHNLFVDEPNTFIKNFKAEFKVKEGCKPIFHRAYEMPYSLKPKVEQELLKMVDSGVLSKVTYSKWASPIVIVPKKNSNDIRLCVDFKKTINRSIDSEHCVLPLPSDIFASLNGGIYFCVIDLKGAYQQLQISESSKELFTINTHIGLFRYNRLTYGISSAPGIFQCIMDAILSNLSKTKCYLDDILIHGSSLEECYKNVRKVLERLREFNVKINEEKCKFFKQSVEFLGHKIDSQGIHPTNEKLECIQKAPSPQNVTQLKSYLGILNYYGKFIHMLSAKLKPLYDLCKSGSEFLWTDECERVFQESKMLLSSEDVLTHFDPTKPIFITCDSSGYGVGAVLSHKIDGKERPVLFASSTLTDAEKKYSNLERESLSIIFGLKKFHKYIFGRKFTLFTDHQPLQFIFGKNKSIPVTAAARITRWAISLSAYDYDIVYKKGSSISNADGLSRLPMKGNTEITDSIFSFNLSYEVPLNSNDIATATKKDAILIKVIDFTLSGWPNFINDINLKPYFKRRLEFSVENGCLLVGNKVVIPNQMQKEILKLFHEQHIGIVRTKMLMRSYCWWPGMNEDVELFISSCVVCQETQNFSNSSTLLPWPSAPNNFYRVNIDFFHKHNHIFLILVDNKSKWVEVKLMQAGTNAKETILKLKEIFSTFGLPRELVSDNGPPFSSTEFNAFCQANGIKFIRSPPYHPQSNGIAERSVQTIKKGLEKSLFLEKGTSIDKNTILNRLENFLFVHRNTPSTSTGLSPAENLFKFRPRTRYDLLKPCANQQTELRSDITRKLKLYSENDIVYVKNIHSKLWQKGKIVRCMSYCTYLVQVSDSIKLVHANDIRSYSTISPELSNNASSASASLDKPNSPKVTVPILSINNPIVYNNVSQSEVAEVPEATSYSSGLSQPRTCHSDVGIEPNSKVPVKLQNSSKATVTSDTSPASTVVSKSRYGRSIKPPVKFSL